MSDFNYTIHLAQSEFEDLKGRLAGALANRASVLTAHTRAIAAPMRRGFRPVGRIPYNRHKYRNVTARDVDRVVNREVF